MGYGPELGRSPGGDLRVNTRTLARSMYTQMLLAKYPWLDIFDLRIFLLGFDAGEQWSRCNLYSEAEKPVANSWLTPMEKQFGNVPDMVRDASFHSGSDSQAAMDTTKIVPSEVQSGSSLQVF